MTKHSVNVYRVMVVDTKEATALRYLVECVRPRTAAYTVLQALDNMRVGDSIEVYITKVASHQTRKQYLDNMPGAN